MSLYSETWWFADGTLAANQRAAVFLEDTNTLASIFSDPGMTTPLTNPAVTDASGLLEFYAADARYWVFVGPESTGDSVLSFVGPVVSGAVTSVNGQTGDVVLDAGDVGALPLTGGTVTGDVLLSGAASDLTVQGATTVTFQGVTVNAAEGLAAVLSTGIISGGVVTMSGPASVDITAGVGFILDDYTNPASPVLTRVSFPAQIGVPLTPASLARQITAFAMDSAGVLSQIDPPTNVQDRQYLILGNVVQLGAGNFVTDTLQFRTTQPAQQLYDFMKAVGPFVASGNLLTPIPGGLTFSRSGGQLFAPGSNTNVNRADPHVVTTVTNSPQTVRYATQIPGSSEIAGHTNVYPGDYDVGGVVTPIPGSTNRATVQRLWYFTSGSGGVIVQYGQQFYTTLEEAILNMNTQTFIENPNLQYATLLGALAITKGCTDLADTTTARFFSAIKLGGSFVGATLGVTVLSVNGETGNVVLDASDVGAIPVTLPDAKGDILTATADNTPARLPAGTNGQALRANSATATGLEWDTLTASDVGADPAGSAAAAAAASQPLATIDAKGDLYAGTGPDTTTRLPVGTDGQALRANSLTATGLEWDTLTAGDVGADPAGSAAAAQAASQPLDSDLTAIAALSPADNDILQRKAGAWTNRSIAQYKTDQAYTASEVGAIPSTLVDAKGDIITATADNTPARLAAGSNGQVLSANSATSTGLEWVTPSGGSGLSPVVKPRAGGYVQCGGVDVVRSSKTATLNAMFLRPFVLTDAATLIAMAFELTSSTATAVARLGIYASNASLLPDARIVDFGTFTADTIGLRAVTGLSQALSADTLYWAAICAQTAAPSMRHSAGLNPWVSSTAFPTGTGAGWNSSYVQTGVSGAFPANVGAITATDAPALGIGF